MRLSNLPIVIAMIGIVTATACTPVSSQPVTVAQDPKPTEIEDSLESASSVGTPSSSDSESSVPAEATTDGVVQPDSPATPEPSPTAESGVPASVTVEPGQVRVIPSAQEYASGGLIEAVVVNGLQQTIYTEDSKSDCSIATLERLAADSWQPLSGCGLMRAPLVVPIASGEGKMFTIDPFSNHFGVGSASAEPAFGAGTYRIMFAYRLDPEPEGEAPYEVYSETFDVQP